MSDYKEIAKKVAEIIEKGSRIAAEKVPEVAKTVGDGAKTAAIKTKETVYAALDQDKNGQIDSTDLIIMALKVPGVRIKRDEFLRKELYKHCEKEIIEKAVATTPAKAGIDRELIDRITDSVIKFERNAVSGISAALGMPGGAAMVATIPADIAQYYGYMIRAAQKMLYLYGFPEIDTKEGNVNVDSETLNSLTICLGVMYGVASANNAIKAMAKALATGVEKQLMRRALTKGAIYPFVKNVAKWFGKRMTKEIFAGFFKNTIPVVGGVIGGGVTFVSFKPCCDRLKESLKDTRLANPDHISTKEENEIYESIKNGAIDIEPVEEENAKEAVCEAEDE